MGIVSRPLQWGDVDAGLADKKGTGPRILGQSGRRAGSKKGQRLGRVRVDVTAVLELYVFIVCDFQLLIPPVRYRDRLSLWYVENEAPSWGGLAEK